MKLIHFVAATALASAALVVPAQTTPASGADHSAHHPAAVAAPQSDGEVRKVDTQQGKVTLKHGPLANLDMPAMTMVFRVAEPKMLDGLKEGDKVRFTAERVNGAITVTVIQPAQ
jgi:Cu(I)/Ag(I) efflux system periplasmic protein CusF